MLPINPNGVVLIFLLLSLGVLYHKYIEKMSTTYSKDEYEEIRQYLTHDEALDKSKKPILWIHIPYEYNSRQWLTFGSRSSSQLNQPYLHLCVKSIVQHCKDSFKIVFIDDGSFEKLVPNWSIQMNLLADPIKSYVRQMALAKLVYYYGGMNIPISFLCAKDLAPLFSQHSFFVCESVNDSNVSSTNKLFYPDIRFMGARKQNETLREFIDYMERKISSDFTSQTAFLGEFDKWCLRKQKKDKVVIIPGTHVGTKTIQGDPVLVEHLLGEDYIRFYDQMYGIWIPADMILKRNHYSWFAYLSPEEIFQSSFLLAKHFVSILSEGVIEKNEM
jgi:hypothetical protein